MKSVVLSVIQEQKINKDHEEAFKYYESSSSKWLQLLWIMKIFIIRSIFWETPELLLLIVKVKGTEEITSWVIWQYILLP